jgi:hypothetical protein
MISTGKWLELCQADAERRGATAVRRAAETFSARVSRGSLASPEEITVSRLLDDRRTHDLIYRPDAEGNFVFQCMLER